MLFLFAILFVASSMISSSNQGPTAIAKNYYQSRASLLAAELSRLHNDIRSNQPLKTIQRDFLSSRLAYKKIELFIGYYQDGDEPRFNGVPTGFIEEEDPDAYQEPQGFQMIETFLFPGYDAVQKDSLLYFSGKLMTMAQGIARNTTALNPDQYLPDAIMEELYRIITLGITGFDTPLSPNAIPEAAAALESVRFVINCYRTPMQTAGIHVEEVLQLIDQSIVYCRTHPAFAGFNRMQFIRNYLNPVCEWWGKTMKDLGYPENPTRYTLIRKAGSLFRAGSLRTDAYLGDDRFTPLRAALGKKLFYEPRLSASGRRSCAGCHQPDKAFTDGLATALQSDEHSPLPRNTPTLWNAALQHNLFYDSRQTSMDKLVTEVLSNEKEMNSGAEQAIEKIISDTAYAELFRKAYRETNHPFSASNAVNALSMYLRTLVSYNAPFDQYMRGDDKAMSLSAIKGFNLFAGKAKCATCHYIPFFNGAKPPLWFYQESETIGVPAAPLSDPPKADPDPGRFAIYPKPFFAHAFKTPTLRNIALTAPYMHNGVYKTLEEVIDFYDKGGGRGMGLEVPNQTLPFQKLGLSDKEKRDLKAFLNTLTDTLGLNTSH